MIILHNSITGSSRRLAERFSYPSKHLRSYMGGNDGIIIVGRRFFTNENLWELDNFIKQYKRKIKGVIIYDDKVFGRCFGESADFFANHGLEILVAWDKTVSDEQIRALEVKIDGIV